MSDLREQLAALAHDQWSGWMQYLFQLATTHSDQTVVIQPEHVLRWKRQMNMSYAELSEAEKNSDREEADRVLALIGLMDGE